MDSINIHIHIYIYIQICMYIQLCKHIYMYVFMYTCLYIYIYMYMYVCTSVYIYFLSVCGVFKHTLYVCVNASVGAHACDRVLDMSTHTRTLCRVVFEQKA